MSSYTEVFWAPISLGQVKYRVKIGGLLRKLLGDHDGQTIGATIYLKPGRAVSSTLIAHEFGHVLQFRRHGFVKFLWRYATSAWWRTRAEAEATKFAQDNAEHAHFKMVAKRVSDRMVAP